MKNDGIKVSKADRGDFGLWMVEPLWFQEAIQFHTAKNSVREPVAFGNGWATWTFTSGDGDQEHLSGGTTNMSVQKLSQDRDDVNVTSDGIAVIQLVGPLTKGFSFFSGTSTVEIRSKLRAALINPDVKAILLHIDSPGGTVAGTADLADDVKAVNKIKPVVAHIDDLGASAAFWVASQATRITANRTAEVGSIGTVAVVDDLSKMFDKAGIKVHVISTGKFKGAFEMGSEITDAQLEHLQEVVDDLNEHFLEGVTEGRDMSMSDLKKVADGRTFIASKAMGFGLIDAVQPISETVSEIASFINSEKDKKSGRLRLANVKIRLSELNG